MAGASLDVVQVVVRAAVPLAGVLFLGWPAGNQLFVYGADVLAALYVVCLLASARLYVFEVAAGPAWWRRLWWGAQLALTALIPFAAIAVPIVASMAFVLVEAGFDWRAALHRRDLWLAAGAQFAAALGAVMRDWSGSLDAPGVDVRIKRLAGLAFLRWGVVAAAAFGVIAVLPQRGLLLVAVATLAQIGLELHPARALRAFGAPELAALPVGPAQSAQAVPPAQAAPPAHVLARRRRRPRRR